MAVSPRLAERIGLANGDLVETAIDGQSVVGPAWIMPGQAPNTVALFLGYGRSASAAIVRNLGYSAYSLRPADNASSASGTIRRAGGSRNFASTQLASPHGGVQFRARGERAAPDPANPDRATEPLSPVAERRLCLGNGDRPRSLHWLQRLRDRMQHREQRACRRQGPGRDGPRHAVVAYRSLLHGRSRKPAQLFPTGALHAL